MTRSLPTALYRAAQVRALDREAIETHGIPGFALMERAGLAAFELLRQQWPTRQRLCVVCGIGNNAGDGYVLARLAHLAGYAVKVQQVGDSQRLQGSALQAWQAMQAVGVTVQPFQGDLPDDAEVLAEALFGTGLDRPLTDHWAAAVTAINCHPAPVLALDLPAGLHADTGTVLGVAVQAALTLTFIGLKPGLLTGVGPDYCGTVYFDDLQIPAASDTSPTPAATRWDAQCLTAALPPRPRCGHKGDFGQVLVIGGEQGYTGALRLAGAAAARVGAGKVSLATRAAHAPWLSLDHPELMCHGVESAAALLPLLAQADVVAIGPGLGQLAWGRSLLAAVMGLHKPLVIDADALNLWPAQAPRLEHAVFTPHPGEAARLLQTTTAAIQADRFAAITALQQRYGGVWILKGAGTLILDQHAHYGLCSAGNPGMGSGGMGDLLTGVIASLLAQGFSLADAARLGVCLHAAAGDRAAAEGGERGLLASDLLPWLRRLANPGTGEA